MGHPINYPYKMSKNRNLSGHWGYVAQFIDENVFFFLLSTCSPQNISRVIAPHFSLLDFIIILSEGETMLKSLSRGYLLRIKWTFIYLFLYL